MFQQNRYPASVQRQTVEEVQKFDVNESQTLAEIVNEVDISNQLPETITSNQCGSIFESNKFLFINDSLKKNTELYKLMYNIISSQSEKIAEISNILVNLMATHVGVNTKLDNFITDYYNRIALSEERRKSLPHNSPKPKPSGLIRKDSWSSLNDKKIKK